MAAVAPSSEPAHRAAAPSEEAGAAGLARAFRRKCGGLLPLGCCAEELRTALWQLLSHVLARSFAGSLDGPQLCGAIASGFSSDPNVDDETRTPTRCAAQGEHILTEVEWTGRYGPKPAPRRYGRRQERVRQLLLSPAACSVMASLAFDRMGASETLGEVAHVLFALLSACVTFGLPAVSAALARDAEHGKLVRRWGLPCPAGATPKGIGGVVGLLALRGAEAMAALLHYGRSLDGSGGAAIPSFGQLSPLSETAWRRNSEAEQWHVAPRPLLVRDGATTLNSADERSDSGDAAEHNSLPWSSWLDTPKRIFEELIAQASGFAEPGVRWSKMAEDLMEEEHSDSSACASQVVEQTVEWQPRRGYFSKVALNSVGGRHCVVQLFVCPLRRGASAFEGSCELVAEAIAACLHSDGQTYRMLLPRQLAMSWVQQAMAVDGSCGVHQVLDQQAPGQCVLCDEPTALPQCIKSAERASGFVKVSFGLLSSPALLGSARSRKPVVKCCVETVAGVLFVDAPTEQTVDYGAWEQWRRREDEAAAMRSNIASALPVSRSHVATQMSTMTYMVNADDDIRVREATLDARRKQRVDAVKLRLDELAEEIVDLTDDWNETEDDEDVRRARLRSERRGVQLLEREPEGIHRYAKVSVRCNAIWSDLDTASTVEVEVAYKTHHGTAWPDDHYLTRRGRLRFSLDRPAPGLQSHEGTTELQEVKVPIVYNQAALMDTSTAASDPLHFKVIIESAEVVSELDGKATLGAQCTTVYLTSPVQPAPRVADLQEEKPKFALEQWTPFKASLPFCRTCGRVASDKTNAATMWNECLHAHGLPQRFGQRPGLCQDLSAGSELAAAFAVRRLRTMDTGRAPRRRTKTVAQRREHQAAADAEALRMRQKHNPLQWLDKVNEPTRVSELDRVLNMLAAQQLEWGGKAYSDSVWQQLALGRRDALYFLRVTVNRMAEDGIAYEPPEDQVSLDTPSSPDAASTPDARRHDHNTSQGMSLEGLTGEQRKAKDTSRATWLEFRRAVRKYVKVCSDELSENELRDAYAIAADEDGTIDRSELAEMLAMTDAATAFAKTQRPSVHLNGGGTHGQVDRAAGKESLDRLDAASRRLNLRYCFHVGALTHREYSAAVKRLDNIEEEIAQNSLIDHRLLSPELSCSAETLAEKMLPGVLSRLPGIRKAAQFETPANGIRDLAEEWKEEMFNLTARKYWQPDPRLAVQQLGLALIHSGGDCDTRGWNGQTVLIACAKDRFLEGALFLLHKGANRLIQNNQGWSALMIAAKHGHAEMCVALLTAAIETNKQKQDGTRQHMLNQTNSAGDTALDIAIGNDMGACADLLAAYGAVVSHALKGVAARQAGSGGWLHLAAASAAAGEASAEAIADAKEIEQIVQRSSRVALEEGRSTQLARQADLGRKLYGTKQASGKILPTVADQGWGPNMAEKEAYKLRSRVFQRDAEWVELSGAMAPRAMHRNIALEKNRHLWGKALPSSPAEGQRKTEPQSDLPGVGGKSKTEEIATPTTQYYSNRQLHVQAESSLAPTSVCEQTGRQEQTFAPANVTEAGDHACVETARVIKKKLKIPSMREQLRNRKQSGRGATRERVRIPSMREQMAALAQ